MYEKKNRRNILINYRVINKLSPAKSIIRRIVFSIKIFFFFCPREERTHLAVYATHRRRRRY